MFSNKQGGYLIINSDNNSSNAFRSYDNLADTYSSSGNNTYNYDTGNEVGITSKRGILSQGSWSVIEFPKVQNIDSVDIQCGDIGGEPIKWSIIYSLDGQNYLECRRSTTKMSKSNALTYKFPPINCKYIGLQVYQIQPGNTYYTIAKFNANTTHDTSHVSGLSVSPVGTGAGTTGAYALITPYGNHGILDVKCGAAPAANSLIVSFLTNDTRLIVITPANANAAALAVASTPYMLRKNTGYDLRSNTTAMTAAVLFQYYYHFV
jgi:hypothetical protein